MGNHYLNDEQVDILRNNPYIQKVTNKSIKYSQVFKEEFWHRYSQGETPSSILISFDIDPKILGASRIRSTVQRIKTEANRLEGFADTRQVNSGRPKRKDMTSEEKIKYLEHKIAYQKQEIEFLKKIRYVEKKVMRKQQKKNTKS